MRKFITSLLVATVAAGALFASVGSASASEEGKVLVCKYVGTPGEDERLKDGKNPIEVDAGSTGGATAPGSIFADAQGRSMVIGEEDVCPATPDAYSKFRLTVRMTGTGSPYRDSIRWFTGSPVSGTVTGLICDAKISAAFDVAIGSKDLSTPTFASRKGPILRVYEAGTLVLKLKAADAC